MVVFKKWFLFLVLLTVKCMVVKFVSGDSKSTTNYMVDVNHSSIMLERKSTVLPIYLMAWLQLVRFRNNFPNCQTTKDLRIKKLKNFKEVSKTYEFIAQCTVFLLTH